MLVQLNVIIVLPMPGFYHILYIFLLYSKLLIGTSFPKPPVDHGLEVCSGVPLLSKPLTSLKVFISARASYEDIIDPPILDGSLIRLILLVDMSLTAGVVIAKIVYKDVVLRLYGYET